MSGYLKAKQYIDGLKDYYNENKTYSKLDIKSYNRGFLNGIQEHKLPEPRLIKSILTKNGIESHPLLEVLVSEGIVE